MTTPHDTWGRPPTLAQRARAFVASGHRRCSPAEIHDTCNAYLRALRSGSRRRTYHTLRVNLRALRAKTAEKENT